MATTHTAGSAAMGLAIWGWATLIGGCGGAMRAELASARSLNAAAANIEPTLRDYHRDAVADLEDDESRLIDRFVRRVRLDSANPSASDAHVVRFTAELDRLHRRRLAEEGRYRTTMHRVGALRSSAERLQRSAEAGAGVQGTVRRYLDLLLAGDLPAPLPESASVEPDD